MLYINCMLVTFFSPLNKAFKSLMPLASMVSGDTALTPWSECQRQHFSPPCATLRSWVATAWLQSCLAYSHYAVPLWWKPVAAAKRSGKKKKSTVVSATEAPVSVSDPSPYASQEGAQYVSVCNRSGSLGPKVSTCDTKEVLRPAEGPNIISANSPTGSTWSR